MNSKIAIINPGFLYDNIFKENQIKEFMDIKVIHSENIDIVQGNILSSAKIIYVDDYESSFDLLVKEYQNYFLQKVEFKSLVDFYEKFHERAAIFNIDGEIHYPFYIDSLTENKFYGRILRILDLAIALTFSIFSVFVVLFSGFLIFVVSGLPVFFTQERVGKNGKTFTIYKLRTMINGTFNHHSVPNDPRILPLGMFFRRVKIDELPQLVNIIFGHMSFFGPRPERSDFHLKICGKLTLFNKRLIVKPGLSGWAQIKNPIATPNDSFEKLQYDIYFIKNISFKMLIKIIFKTIIILLNKKSN